MKKYKFVRSTHSTNILLKELLKENSLPEFFAVRTSFQTSGKGQMGNSWESEKSMNLLCSILLKPHHIAIEEQFVISQMVSVAIVNVLALKGINAQIKWPNDIYVGNKKIAGILIENSLRNAQIDTCIVGIGLNVNQLKFHSNAPNPISMATIIQKKSSISDLFKLFIAELKQLYLNFDFEILHKTYLKQLYRYQSIHSYRLPNGKEFKASIVDIQTDGQLVLKSESNELAQYYFKEVEFMINNK